MPDGTGKRRRSHGGGRGGAARTNLDKDEVAGVSAGGASSPPHLSVLAREALEYLNVRPDGRYVDCTVGAGGHALAIAGQLETGHLVGIDRDEQALSLARARLGACGGVTLVQANYDRLADIVAEVGWPCVDGVLLDAGLSSMQIDDAQRGFSFQDEGPLDMRMDTAQPDTARDFLSRIDVPELARVLRELGDVKPAKRIAAAIVARRNTGALTTTGDLAAAVREALPFVSGMPQETRTVFQAIRMAVNRELESLDAALRQALDVLAPNGRLVCISFHSGEDRVAKRILKEATRKQRELEPDGRVKAVIPARARMLTPKAVTPGEAECRANPRAHSARLRAVERLG